MKSLRVCVLTCVVVGSPCLVGKQVKIEDKQSTTVVAAAPESEQSESVDLDPIITQAINFSNAIGDWFDDLFDKKQNMSFNTHVNALKKIVNKMQLAIIKPLVIQKDHDVVALAAYNLTSILYARALKTYEVLDANRKNAGFMKIANALKKVEKVFKSEQEKTKLKKAFADLIERVDTTDPELSKKISTLEAVVAENSVRTKKKGWWKLMWGLRHRLQQRS